MKKSFTKRVLLRFHKLTLEFWKMLLALLVITVLTDFFFKWATYYYVDFEDITIIGIIIILSSLIWTAILLIGFVRIITEEKTKASIKDLIMSAQEDGGRIILSTFVASAIVSLFLIIPILGIYVALRTQFFFYAQIHQRKYFIKSLKESIGLTKGKVLKQLGIWLLITGAFIGMILIVEALPANIMDFPVSKEAWRPEELISNSILHFLVSVVLNFVFYLMSVLHLSMYLELKEEKAIHTNS